MSFKYLKLLSLISFLAFSGVKGFSQSKMSGVYTIGKGSKKDYSTVTGAVADLIKNGISAPVSFLIEDGTYTGEIYIDQKIKGTSPRNKIYFIGNNEDRSKVLLTNSANDVLKIFKSKYFHFQDLTIHNTNKNEVRKVNTVYLNHSVDISFTNVFLKHDGLNEYTTTTNSTIKLEYSDSNSLTNCRIENSDTFRNNYNVYFEKSNYNVISNSDIIGAIYGVIIRNTLTDRKYGNTVVNSRITGFRQNGLNIYSERGFKFKDNIIYSQKIPLSINNLEGYTESGCQGSEIVSNDINVRGIALTIDNANSYYDTTSIINNVVFASYGYALNIRTFRKVNIFHNSFHSTSSQALYMRNTNDGYKDIRVANNIFSSSSTHGLYIYLKDNNPDLWDYNNYYFPNSTANFASYNSKTYARYSDFKSLTWGTNNSLNIDPEFDGANLRTYAIGLNNKGISLIKGQKATRHDIDKSKRPNKYERKVDIGPNDYYHYCLTEIDSLSDDYAISRVMVNNLDKKSVLSANGFTYYGKDTIELYQGESYLIAVDRLKGSTNLSRNAWIDFNDDGEYGTNERIMEETSSSQTSVQDSFLVPIIKGTKELRCRVLLTEAKKTVNNCDALKFGEVEEYPVKIMRDTFPPIITLVGSKIDTININTNWKEIGYSAFDNLEGNITSSVIVETNIDTSNVGEYWIKYTSKDNNGNTAIKYRKIIVIDRSLPKIYLNGADTIYVHLHDVYKELGAIAIDNGRDSLSVTATGKVNTVEIGIYTITYCATDSFGNGPSCLHRTIIVFDSIAPIITLNGLKNVKVEVYSEYIDSLYTASDNDSFSVIIAGTYEDSDSLGVFDRVYTAIDESGNKTTATRIIEVVDTQKPVIELVGPSIDSVERWEDYIDEGYIISDNYYAIEKLNIDTAGTFINTESEGVFTITYVARDPSGNVSDTISRTILVIDPLFLKSLDKKPVVSIYPNPTKDKLFIESSKELQISTIRIIDFSGKVVLNAHSIGKFTRINLEHFNNGIYLVEVKFVNGMDVRKIVRKE